MLCSNQHADTPMRVWCTVQCTSLGSMTMMQMLAARQRKCKNNRFSLAKLWRMQFEVTQCNVSEGQGMRGEG